MTHTCVNCQSPSLSLTINIHLKLGCHYNDGIMSAMASQITSLTIVYSIVYSGADQRKHQSSASLAFVQGIHRWPVNSPPKRPVTRKMFPFDDVIVAASPLAKGQPRWVSRYVLKKVMCICFYRRYNRRYLSLVGQRSFQTSVYVHNVDEKGCSGEYKLCFLLDYVCQCLGWWYGEQATINLKRCMSVDACNCGLTVVMSCRLITPRCCITHWDRDKTALQTTLSKLFVIIMIRISFKFVPRGPIKNNSAFFQIMTWRWKAPSFYLKQRWPSLLRHTSANRPLYVNAQIGDWYKAECHV